jgi:hypothetical protein
MHRLHFWVLGIIAVVLIGSAAIVFGESEGDMIVPMGFITLRPPESVEARRSDVEFPHATHFDFDCRTCHHKWEKEEVIQGCSTSGCHDVEVSPIKSGKGNLPKEESIKYYKAAYHQMCIGCHKEMKRVNKALEMSLRKLPSELPTTGPTGCIQCHPKEE